jgi:DNA-binding XRE family transcriptional regulator
MAKNEIIPEIRVTIKLNILEKIEQMQKSNGTTKAWVARKLGVSNQRLYSILKADNLTLDVLIRIAYILRCDITDLYTAKIEEQLNIFDDINL